LEGGESVWIKDLTANLSLKAEAHAVLEATNNIKLIQEELTALLSAK